MSLNWEEVEAGSLVRQATYLCWNFYEHDVAFRMGVLEAIGRENVPEDIGRLLDLLWRNAAHDPSWHEELEYMRERPRRGDPGADFASWWDAKAASYSFNLITRALYDRGSLMAQSVATFTLAADTLEAMLAGELVRDDDVSVFFDEDDEQELAQAFMVVFQETAREIERNIRRRR